MVGKAIELLDWLDAVSSVVFNELLESRILKDGLKRTYFESVNGLYGIQSKCE